MAIVAENKFKVGDWVRCIDDGNTDVLTNGNVYKVHRVTNQFVYIDDDVTGGMYSHRFEPWTPKVGERVRYKNTEFGEATVLEVDGEDIKVDTHGRYKICTERVFDLEPVFTEFTTEPLPVITEPVAAPAQPVAQPISPPALTIQTGRYYRTRDGRKVGPMEEHDNVALDTREPLVRAFVDADVRLWRTSNGAQLFNNESLDLIAEWIDEPVVAVTEVASPQEEEPTASGPKFKVGDRVTPSHRMTKDTATIVKIEDGVISVSWNDGAFGGTWGWREEELALVANEDSVEPTTTLVDITNLEDLDAIIARLKKIRKLQRKIAA